jgi:hypothetical protein
MPRLPVKVFVVAARVPQLFEYQAVVEANQETGFAITNEPTGMMFTDSAAMFC